eukprot:1478430-Amphidinium_carterae.1
MEKLSWLLWAPHCWWQMIALMPKDASTTVGSSSAAGTFAWVVVNPTISCPQCAPKCVVPLSQES